MNSKSAFIFFIYGVFALTVRAQTPNLQAVTNAGDSTNKSICIWNKDGLNIGVDVSTGYTTKSHYLRPSPTETRTMRFDCTSSTTTGGWEFYNGAQARSIMFIKQSSGYVGIGTTDPKARLAVNGDIYAKKVRVTPDDWPDFVFESAYELPSLQDLELFIAEHKHLPGIPSAKEVGEQGVDLGQNQAKLLQKIEEMTLYLIEQNKRVAAQEQVMKAQDEMFAVQDERLKELEKRIDHK
ncbi:hypothetical protein [Chitinophaga filiformis]|uniref:Uncharacterized protein n=1 Tax=Chitinophaga filiformis TaxID=104663 RepID=A0A1G7NC84_CHIFI|nr:hypothetical protein [Chitinophaga filiformis]SDF70939.1 hypothetical protein SAMN04488121_102725 [Chitinophaga filiformis]